MNILGYQGGFLDEEEKQVRRTASVKVISVAIIAKIVAVLISEGFVGEAAPVNVNRRISTFCSLLVVLISVSMLMFTCVSAAVLAQAAELGKESGKE